MPPKDNKNDTVTVQLTKDEAQRVVLIIGYNIDTNLKDEQDAAMKRNDAGRVAQLQELIESDRALMYKFI